MMEENRSMEGTPAPQTLGESLAHVSRAARWTAAAFVQILIPVGCTLILVYTYRSESSPSFFSSVPWRLVLLLSWSAYMSVLFMVTSYAQLFLPRTPLAVVEKIEGIGLWGVGVCVIGVMVSIVLSVPVEDTRILAGCFCVVAAIVVGLVAFWVWLARTYGGGDPLETSLQPPPDADESSLC